MFRIKILTKPTQHVVDSHTGMIDGQPLMLEDIAILLAKYTFMHPEDKHAFNVLANLAYGRDSE